MSGKPLALALLLLQLLAVVIDQSDCQVSDKNQADQPRVQWFFDVDAFGSASVTVSVDDISKSELQFYLPKTHQDFRINPDLNYSLTIVNGSSYDELTICDVNIASLEFAFVWPDASIQYENIFYFAGQEKFEVGLSTVTVWLPDKMSIHWIESSNFTEDHETLHFQCGEWDVLPSFSYSFVNQPRVDFSLEASEHVTLQYHPVMTGKPWISRTIEIIEHSWNWLKTTLNGTIDHVNVTFAPFGHSDLGVKYGGFCHYNSRNIEIVATNQFGIGLGSGSAALILHELSHAFTPLLEDLPSFYSEAIAEDFSYAALRRTSLNESADSLEESRFDNAYWLGVERGLLDYIWLWKWNDTIYDDWTITRACYGISAFIGDYIVHHWGYSAINRLSDFFNKTEIDSLAESQRLPKFMEYLSMACEDNASEIFNTLEVLITQWYDAKIMRYEYYTIEISGPFTWYVNPKLERLVKEGNDEYDNRNYDLAISRFDEAKDLADSRFWSSLDYVFWLVVLLVVIGSVVFSFRSRR